MKIDGIVRLSVDITEKHIKDGVRKDASKCPIALAITECGLFDVHVSNLDIYAYADKAMTKPLHASMSFKESKFAFDFDDKKKIQPFSFEAIFYPADKEKTEEINAWKKFGWHKMRKWKVIE